MKVSKAQIIEGVIRYAENEVIPHIEDKPTQIIAAIAVKAIKANPGLADPLLENPVVKTLLSVGEDGEYETSGIFSAIEESIRLYGDFPVTIPAIPLLSNAEKILTFGSADAQEIRRCIERAGGKE